MKNEVFPGKDQAVKTSFFKPVGQRQGHQKIQNANSYKSLIPKSTDNDLIKLVTHDFQILNTFQKNSFKKKINTLTNLKTTFKKNLAVINVTNNTNKKANANQLNSDLTNNKKFLFLQNSFFKKHLESQITNTFSSNTALLFFKFSMKNKVPYF